jgi:hypothetical protein
MFLCVSLFVSSPSPASSRDIHMHATAPAHTNFHTLGLAAAATLDLTSQDNLPFELGDTFSHKRHVVANSPAHTNRRR